MGTKNEFFAIATFIYNKWYNSLISKKRQNELFKELVSKKEYYRLHDLIDVNDLIKENDSMLIKNLLINEKNINEIINYKKINKVNELSFERCIFTSPIRISDINSLTKININNCVFFNCLNIEYKKLNTILNSINISNTVFTNGLYIDGNKEKINNISLNKLMFTKKYNDESDKYTIPRVEIKDLEMNTFCFTTLDNSNLTHEMYKNVDFKSIGNFFNNFNLSRSSQIASCYFANNIFKDSYIDISKSNTFLSFDKDKIILSNKVDLVLDKKLNKVKFCNVLNNGTITLFKINKDKDKSIGEFYNNIEALEIDGPGIIIGIDYEKYLKQYYYINKKEYLSIDKTIHNLSIILAQFIKSYEIDSKGSNYRLKEKMNYLYGKYLFSLEFKDFIKNNNRKSYSFFKMILEIFKQIFYKISRYGTSASGILVFCFLTIVFFSIIYFILLYKSGFNYLECLRYSAISFVAMGYNLENCQIPICCTYIGILEAFIGVPSLGYFVSVESGKILSRNK